MKFGNSWESHGVDVDNNSRSHIALPGIDPWQGGLHFPLLSIGPTQEKKKSFGKSTTDGRWFSFLAQLAD